jgi:F0F1-type ATP synthase membrane subunit b/b'
MDAIFSQLGELLRTAVPTVLIVIFVHFYLKGVFFKPLQKVLHKRYEATEGAKKHSEESLKRAAAKAAEYEAALRQARGEVYQSQDQVHRQLQEQEARAIAEARGRVEARVKEAKEGLRAEIEAAKVQLAAETGILADQIADSVLRRSLA